MSGEEFAVEATRKWQVQLAVMLGTLVGVLHTMTKFTAATCMRHVKCACSGKLTDILLVLGVGLSL